MTPTERYQFPLRVPHGLLDRLDERRGGESRNAYVVRAIEHELDRAEPSPPKTASAPKKKAKVKPPFEQRKAQPPPARASSICRTHGALLMAGRKRCGYPGCKG